MAQAWKEKKKPERRCVGCGERKEKNELVRIVRTKEGEVLLDKSGKLSGRGAYICRSVGCFRKARKAKRFENALGVAIPEEVCTSLEKELGDGDK